nr:MAG TPA: hypothetical protein [Caudoviricetes sp.]
MDTYDIRFFVIIYRKIKITDLSGVALYSLTV